MSKLSKIIEQLQNRNRYLLFLDLVLLPIAVGISFLLRLDNFDPVEFGAGYLFFTVLALVITPITYYAFGIYSRYWPFASIDEMVLLIGATTTAAAIIGVISLIVVWLLAAASTLPRSIPFIFFPVELALTAGPRFIIRVVARYQRQKLNGSRVNGKKTRSPKNVLIVGAGYAGVMLAREIRINPDLALEPVGFIDDDPRKVHTYIQGLPVLGGRDTLRQAMDRFKVEQVIIAMPTASGKIIREIANTCEQLAVQARIIPGMYAILDEAVSVNQLRKVEIEDLLRREPVQTDIAAVRELLSGKRVLITGGGGSIGGELCRQVLRCEPTELIVLGHGENSIFEICNELQRKLDSEAKRRAQQGVSVLPPMIHPVIADIRCADRVQAVFQQYRPEIVFHAAAPTSTSR
jgi:FlaA1/EpsC-like NDP-sugar epimerase